LTRSSVTIQTTLLEAPRAVRFVFLIGYIAIIAYGGERIGGRNAKRAVLFANLSAATGGAAYATPEIGDELAKALEKKERRAGTE
jgi:hypothetical protein